MTTLRERIVENLENRGLINKNQVTQAYVTLYDRCVSEKNYAICEIILAGIGTPSEADMVTIQVEVDGTPVKKVDVPVTSGSSQKYEVTVPKDKIINLNGRRSDCSVMVQDTYFRPLAFASGNVEFQSGGDSPKFSIGVSFNRNICIEDELTKVHVADVDLASSIETPLSLDLYGSGGLLWHDTAHTVKGSAISRPIYLDATVFSGVKSELRFQARYNGGVIKEEFVTISVERVKSKTQEEGSTSSGPTPVIASDVNADGDLLLPPQVDVHETLKGEVCLGKAVITNRGRNALDLNVTVLLDGDVLYMGRNECAPGKNVLEIKVPFTKVAREDSYDAEVQLDVSHAGKKVAFRTSTLPIRSKYDFSLRAFGDRIPKFVNPRDPIISGVVQDVNGPLAKAMTPPYRICGYQSKGVDLLKEMSAVFDMLRDYGITYISDTFTVPLGGKQGYQRVKSPAKTFETKNGNCMELSLLFAAFYECMGLEPVVIILPTHAMVGVVVETDEYKSDADVDSRYLKDCKNLYTVERNGCTTRILVVESTLCAHKNATFDYAGSSSMNTLKECNDKNKPLQFYFLGEARTKDKIFPIQGL